MGKEVTQLVGFRVLAEERYTTKRETRGADERVVPGENSTSREDEDGEEAKGGKRRKKKKKKKNRNQDQSHNRFAHASAM